MYTINSLILFFYYLAHKSSANLQLTPPSSNSNSIKRVSSVNSLLNYNNSTSILSSKSLTNVYSRVWQLIELYKVDPYPEVFRMANFIFDEIYSKAFTRETNSSLFISEQDSSSPIHRQSYFSRESPTMVSESESENNKYSRTSTPVRETAKHHSGRVSVSALSSPYLPHSTNYYNFMTQFTMKRTIFGREPMLEDFSERNGSRETKDSNNQSNLSFSELPSCRKPLVHTAFVDWCTKHFCQPCSQSGMCCSNIELSQSDVVGEWKSSLLKKYYEKTKRELENTSNFKNGNEIVIQRKNIEANLLSFHPFEKSVVFSNANTFSVWNYTLKADTEPVKFSNENHDAKITDLQLINTHNKALLMTASDNGSIKIWRDIFPTTFSNVCPNDNASLVVPQLSTAFFMFEDKSTERNNLLLSWDQSKLRIIAGGEHKYLRLWDANKEMKIRDITNTDFITSLSTDYIN